ncbi:MAG: CHAT domain-containing protein, partial [Acidobacteria bacterium]|nr:CHAT domain-containing protein [Acidobacteriota bacterium]
LYDGNKFLIEDYEISYTPSVAVLDRCLKKPATDRRKVLLAGVVTAQTPVVEAEIEAVGKMFDESVRFLGKEATVENLRRSSAGSGVVHLACHGKFRQDNPGFSSLVLYSEELTVKEVQNFPLENCMVVLSACESGLNEVVRGEELIGLTRAFIAAGASSLVLSLWRVDDHATLQLMETFYAEFCGGKGVGESLRTAQRRLIEAEFHPYLWSPFILTGRW